MQEWWSSITNALELRLFCIKVSIQQYHCFVNQKHHIASLQNHIKYRTTNENHHTSKSSILLGVLSIDDSVGQSIRQLENDRGERGSDIIRLYALFL